MPLGRYSRAPSLAWGSLFTQNFNNSVQVHGYLCKNRYNYTYLQVY